MIHYATRDQVQKLLYAARNSVRDRAMLTVMYWRGLRVSEVGKLLLSDWRPETGRLYVRRSKNGISAEYMVSDDEKRALGSWLRVRGNQPGPLFVSQMGAAISVRQVQRLFAHYARRAGWPDELQHAHVLRHSIAVHLVEKSIDVLAIKDWLGHREIESTMVYARMTNPVRDRVAQMVYQPEDGTKIRVDWKKARKRK